MYQNKDISVNITKYMLPSVVPKVLRKPHNIPHSQKTPIMRLKFNPLFDQNSILYNIRIHSLSITKYLVQAGWTS